jgi:MFS superfamily sulfate permease-like transporter
LTFVLLAHTYASQAYAELGGLLPVFGLYSNLVGPIMYALFGSGARSVVGPLALTCILTKLAVDAAQPEDTAAFERLSFVVALLVGVEQLLMGALRVGAVVELVSKPVLSAFTTAAGVIIAHSQLLSLTGLECVATDSCGDNAQHDAAPEMFGESHHKTTVVQFIDFLKNIKYVHFVRHNLLLLLLFLS